MRRRTHCAGMTRIGWLVDVLYFSRHTPRQNQNRTRRLKTYRTLDYFGIVLYLSRHKPQQNQNRTKAITITSTSHPILVIPVMSNVKEITDGKRPLDNPYLLTESSPARMRRRTYCAGKDVPEKVVIRNIHIMDRTVWIYYLLSAIYNIWWFMA